MYRTGHVRTAPGEASVRPKPVERRGSIESVDIVGERLSKSALLRQLYDGEGFDDIHDAGELWAPALQFLVVPRRRVAERSVQQPGKRLVAVVDACDTGEFEFSVARQQHQIDDRGLILPTWHRYEAGMTMTFQRREDCVIVLEIVLERRRNRDCRPCHESAMKRRVIAVADRESRTSFFARMMLSPRPSNNLRFFIRVLIEATLQSLDSRLIQSTAVANVLSMLLCPRPENST